MSTSEYKTRSFAAINNNEDIRMKSSSGGVFYELAKFVIGEKGIVYGAGFAEDGQVCHKGCSDLSSLRELMQSKYVQSSIGEIYSKVRELLSADRIVLFTGTPCQVYGLLSFLEVSKVDTGNLLTADFVCHGVPSRKIWRLYLKEISDGRKPESISFRDKTNGWKDFSLKVQFTDGSEYLRSKNNDPYVQGFLKNLYLRESCYHCEFRGVDRQSDFTIADFWKVQEYIPEMFDDKGTSIVMAHNQKAVTLLESLQSLQLREIDNEVIVQTNRPVVKSVQRNPKRDAFFDSMLQEHIGDQIKTAIYVPFTQKVINKIKRMVK